MVFHFIAKFVLAKKKISSRVIFQLDVVHNLTSKLLQELLDKKLLSFSIQASSKSFESHRMAPSVFLG
jgi:hypothetical protein